MNQSSPTIQKPIQAPLIIIEPAAAELSAAGHWGETQVIESIKQANLRNKNPNRVLAGQITQPLNDPSVVTDGPIVGRLITPKLRKRTRIKRFLSYLSS